MANTSGLWEEIRKLLIWGLKVNPIEVESVIMEMPEVLDVTVYGEKHYIFNRIVCARVTPKDPVTDTKAFGKSKGVLSRKDRFIQSAC